MPSAKKPSKLTGIKPPVVDCEVLRAAYKANPYLTPERITDLASKHDRTRVQISRYFSYRRRRLAGRTSQAPKARVDARTAGTADSIQDEAKLVTSFTAAVSDGVTSAAEIVASAEMTAFTSSEQSAVEPSDSERTASPRLASDMPRTPPDNQAWYSFSADQDFSAYSGEDFLDLTDFPSKSIWQPGNALINVCSSDCPCQSGSPFASSENPAKHTATDASDDGPFHPLEVASVYDSVLELQLPNTVSFAPISDMPDFRFERAEYQHKLCEGSLNDHAAFRVLHARSFLNDTQSFVQACPSFYPTAIQQRPLDSMIDIDSFDPYMLATSYPNDYKLYHPLSFDSLHIPMYEKAPSNMLFALPPHYDVVSSFSAPQTAYEPAYAHGLYDLLYAATYCAETSDTPAQVQLF